MGKDKVEVKVVDGVETKVVNGVTLKKVRIRWATTKRSGKSRRWKHRWEWRKVEAAK